MIYAEWTIFSAIWIDYLSKFARKHTFDAHINTIWLFKQNQNFYWYLLNFYWTFIRQQKKHFAKRSNKFKVLDIISSAYDEVWFLIQSKIQKTQTLILYIQCSWLKFKSLNWRLNLNAKFSNIWEKLLLKGKQLTNTHLSSIENILLLITEAQSRRHCRNQWSGKLWQFTSVIFKVLTFGKKSATRCGHISDNKFNFYAIYADKWTHIEYTNIHKF